MVFAVPEVALSILVCKFLPDSETFLVKLQNFGNNNVVFVLGTGTVSTMLTILQLIAII